MKTLLLLLILALSSNVFIVLKTSAQSIGVGVSTSTEEIISDITKSGHSLDGYKKSVLIQEQIIETDVWQATDYVKEDIKSSTYTVQLGDTLWEIAEGYYGDGAMWTNILELNRSSIGFLPDGTQALIVPDQILGISLR